MKNTKIISVIAILAIAFTVLTGCGTDPIADDITNYMKELPAVQTAVDALKDTYNANVGENAADNETLLAVLNDTVIPASNDALEAAKKIVPATKELTAVHEQYITALTTLNSGFVMFADVVTNDKGAEAVAEANDLFASAETQEDAFSAALQALAKDHDLEIK